jgi:excisionase family DNA binding protein
MDTAPPAEQGMLQWLEALLERVLERVAERVLSKYAQREPELMTTTQIAKELGVSDDLVRLWVREQGCPHIRAGEKKLRYRLADVVAWLENKDA